jgi:hypothetical protein
MNPDSRRSFNLHLGERPISIKPILDRPNSVPRNNIA